MDISDNKLTTNSIRVLKKGLLSNERLIKIILNKENIIQEDKDKRK